MRIEPGMRRRDPLSTALLGSSYLYVLSQVSTYVDAYSDMHKGTLWKEQIATAHYGTAEMCTCATLLNNNFIAH